MTSDLILSIYLYFINFTLLQSSLLKIKERGLPFKIYKNECDIDLFLTYFDIFTDKMEI